MEQRIYNAIVQYHNDFFKVLQNLNNMNDFDEN